MEPTADPVGDRVAKLLDAWRQDVQGEPEPVLVAPEEAIRIVQHARRADASPDEAPARTGKSGAVVNRV